MATHTDNLDCPNCGVSEATGLALRIVHTDQDGVLNYIRCEVCGHDEGVGAPSADTLGEQIEPAEVLTRARALLIEDGWSEEDIDEIGSLIADGEYASSES
jgi:DNA-directed RNA polymerase subunit RPC12/RpoP